MKRHPETAASHTLEIMAPAGSYAALAAAIRAGADAVYFGVGHLNMRARAASAFDENDLRKIARICRWCGVRSYLTLNTVVYDDDLEEMQRLCRAAHKAGISAIIAADLAVMHYAHGLGLEVHLSVQANVANVDALRFFARYADTIVPARELTLEQITRLHHQIQSEPICGPAGRPVRLELFAHGALCVAISGKCYMSLATYNHSANRGDCLQNCRRSYRVIDEETGDELVIENHHVMSPRDLCTIGHLDRLQAAGAQVLKIEGRGRTADYVYTVTRTYREALDALYAGSYTHERIAEWTERLRTVFNRGFWQGGYYCGEKLGEWSGSGHSQATRKRIQIGVIRHYYAKPGVAEFRLFQDHLEPGADLLIEGPTTGALHFRPESLRVDGHPAESAHQGDLVTLPVPARVRLNDKIYTHITEESPSNSTVQHLL
ncbi:MAG: U32 family peptidase [Kiritimatiellae bacterium]|nr:U32 family peptidase [Kiritimatiellia bacterium]